eukprot:460378_1
MCNQLGAGDLEPVAAGLAAGVDGVLEPGTVGRLDEKGGIFEINQEYIDQFSEWVKLLKRNKCDSIAWSNEIKDSGYVFADAVPHFTSEEVVVFESCEGDRVPVAAADNGYVVVATYLQCASDDAAVFTWSYQPDGGVKTAMKLEQNVVSCAPACGNTLLQEYAFPPLSLETCHRLPCSSIHVDVAACTRSQTVAVVDVAGRGEVAADAVSYTLACSADVKFVVTTATDAVVLSGRCAPSCGNTPIAAQLLAYTAAYTGVFFNTSACSALPCSATLLCPGYDTVLTDNGVAAKTVTTSCEHGEMTLKYDAVVVVDGDSFECSTVPLTTVTVSIPVANETEADLLTAVVREKCSAAVDVRCTTSVEIEAVVVVLESKTKSEAELNALAKSFKLEDDKGFANSPIFWLLLVG